MHCSNLTSLGWATRLPARGRIDCRRTTVRIIGTLVEDCPKGFDCPRIYATDGAELIVQGYVIQDRRRLAELGIDEDHSAVRVSGQLIRMAAELGIDVPGLRVVAGRDPIVVGSAV